MQSSRLNMIVRSITRRGTPRPYTGVATIHFRKVVAIRYRTSGDPHYRTSVGTWRATSEESPYIIHRRKVQTWHAKSLHWHRNFSLTCSFQLIITVLLGEEVKIEAILEIESNQDNDRDNKTSIRVTFL
ncbi:MAG: hypothetical protein HDS71_04995 [Bacteroidales bacterium]|nr:hypothetical protein [Bacteroidales bacterium]MBD5223393.1 hypothetical protein [Bacteroidales bacterium]